MSTPATAFEEMVGDFSARLIGVETCRVDEVLGDLLRSVVGWFGTDRASFMEFSLDASSLTATHLWGKDPAWEPPPSFLQNELPWYFQQLHRGRDVVLGHLPDDLPVQASAERDYVQRTGMRAIMTVPVAIGGRIRCALSTGAFARTRDWTETDVKQFRIIAEIIANAHDRQRRDAELQATLEQVRALSVRVEAENLYLREEVQAHHEFDEIVGRSAALRRALTSVAQVAPTDAAVLLLGETGTGKELVARAIHQRSPRSRRAFVRVNCAAIPSTLIESELFGHEKGAFTGATSSRPGRFEAADGGTLFLDEVGELDIDVQAKLLRVLQDGSFERVGSTRPQHGDVRIVAATNRDLQQAGRERRFREDLYYRLNVFPISLPPLRDRRGDIPLLVWSVIARRQGKLGKHIETIRQRTMEALEAYDWPGNVRELENVIERALILSAGSVLEVEELTVAGTGLREVPAAPSAARSLADVEREHIQRVLDGCGWRVNGAGNAAEILGLHPNTLRFRMKKLGIARPRLR